MKRDHVLAIRRAISLLPDLAASRAAQPPALDQVFCPPGHDNALDPLRTLVIGNRGMGKSFWAGALTQPDIRARAAQMYSASGKLHELANHRVFVAFPDTAENPVAPDKDVLSSLKKKASWELVWRVVVAQSLSEYSDVAIPSRLSEAVTWARSNPEAIQSLFRHVDKRLGDEGTHALIIFDELDQLADEWSDIQNITQGILRCALGLKKYINIRTKIFMRPDQASNRHLFQFQDASKLYGERVVLEWQNRDLFGLFFHHLLRDANARDALDAIMGRRDLDKLTSDPCIQREVFSKIAGEFMGKDARRGIPYSWIPTHLADGYGEVSPRAFLKALKVAASFPSEIDDLVLTPEALQDGVRQASEVRVKEIGEDYPWVSDALNPLRGILVPCEPKAVLSVWKKNNTVAEIVRKYSGIKAPLELVFAELFDQDKELSLQTALAEIGVIEVRENGKLNFPDIFRIGAGIKRRGGVPPQRRRH